MCLHLVAASIPFSLLPVCSRKMLQPTNESAGLASGPHPLTQRIDEGQAMLEFPGEVSGCSLLFV